MRRNSDARSRNPLPRRFPLVLGQILWIGINLLICIIGALQQRKPVGINIAYSKGVEFLTGNHLTPGFIFEILILGSILASVRWLILEYYAYYGSAPIEVRPLENASDLEVNTRALDVSFRDYLTTPRIYQVTAIPGDPDPDHLIEILKVPASSGWRGLLAATLTYVLPRRAFIVTATLRAREESPRYGVSVQVRRLPGNAIELESQWSQSFERALKRTGFAVAAYILPQTRKCQRPPWSEWQGRVLPASLFRDYQRAKNMVRERRYDEALSLYHRALRQDGNNIALRYDIGQLYERMGLYPDALYVYLELVNQLFPPQPSANNADLRRSAKPRSWPRRPHEAFLIRYRYVVALGLGSVLAKEILSPDWSTLREWLYDPKARESLDKRPWRAVELRDIQRTLSHQLDKLFPSLHEQAVWQGCSLFEATGLRESQDTRGDDGTVEAKKNALAKYLLACAKKEAEALEADFKADNRMSFHLSRFRRESSWLTLTSIRQTSLAIDCQLKRVSARDAGGSSDNGLDGEDESQWRYSVERLNEALRQIGYHPTISPSWLEHYNAACIYALPLVEDRCENPKHLEYAYEALAALERALRRGEDVDFLKAKGYWLQAGDSDLTGLRHYEAFRAFEGRVYSRPLPSFGDIAKYELYLYLRKGLEEAAGSLCSEWLSRIPNMPTKIASSSFEEWWWQEERAWWLIVRLGRFYRQWQTRWLVHRDLRGWIESFGVEAHPFPYPNLIRTSDEWDPADLDAAQDSLVNTEALFRVLGMKGEDYGGLKRGTGLLVKMNSAWAEYARACSRNGSADVALTGEMVDMIKSRAAVWSAVRQWSEHPSEYRARKFGNTVRRLKKPPVTEYRRGC
jgi:hypothetical protein